MHAQRRFRDKSRRRILICHVVHLLRPWSRGPRGSAGGRYASSSTAYDVAGLLLPSVSWEISELTLDDEVSVSADMSGSEVDAAVLAEVDGSVLAAAPWWW